MSSRKMSQTLTVTVHHYVGIESDVQEILKRAGKALERELESECYVPDVRMVYVEVQDSREGS